jgi:hypothetical protein
VRVASTKRGSQSTGFAHGICGVPQDDYRLLNAVLLDQAGCASASGIQPFFNQWGYSVAPCSAISVWHLWNSPADVWAMPKGAAFVPKL